MLYLYGPEAPPSTRQAPVVWAAFLGRTAAGHRGTPQRSPGLSAGGETGSFKSCSLHNRFPLWKEGSSTAANASVASNSAMTHRLSAEMDRPASLSLFPLSVGPFFCRL